MAGIPFTSSPVPLPTSADMQQVGAVMREENSAEPGAGRR